MSLRPQPPLPPVPDGTARVARAAFRRGNLYLLLRDRLGAMFDDAGFVDLYPTRGQPAYAPWRLALVTLLQLREGLSDRQAAEAVRARIDWKYLLGLELADAGFDHSVLCHSVLCEFRGRLLQHEATEHLLARVLDAAREWTAQGTWAATHRQHARARCRARPEPGRAAGRDLACGAERNRRGGSGLAARFVLAGVVRALWPTDR